MYYDIKKSGDRIAELRNRKCVSQNKLAEEIGVHSKTISKAERGINGLSIDYLILLAEHFSVTLDYLVLGVKNEENIASQLYNKCPNERKELLLSIMKIFVEKGA